MPSVGEISVLDSLSTVYEHVSVNGAPSDSAGFITLS